MRTVEQVEAESDELCHRIAEALDQSASDVCIHSLMVMLVLIICDISQSKEEALERSKMLMAGFPNLIRAGYADKEFVERMN